MRLVGIVLVCAACGGSDANVREVEAATYRADGAQLFDLAREVVAKRYELVVTNPLTRTMQTNYVTYNSVCEDAAVTQKVPQDHWIVSLIVQVVPRSDRFAVTVTPRIFEPEVGMKPHELAPDNPTLPDCIHDRVDALRVAIDERARSYR